ncbi:flagellar hook assembly protein FlgD [Vibrio sp. SCSIO 43136]|uniref:flagellar hook assembly protein FlgD n=1 Tax=Vibrio sp. SCSIO 43136 TaxID=2819101 RepID=UPI002075901F|nr:flagellar hook assembly protein FlgD [Vibrio sp. SCSIO 43136]USD64607.1 flagellar hook assembly protein FlgD [Vibrio sp. SCSIO 43136]
MAGIDNLGQSGLSYVDQLKALQEKNKPEEKVTGQNDLKQEDFLSLLTKQLAQQDPFKPVSNDQMIAQMASFATVDGIGKMNNQFESLNSSMTSNQALQASSLVGRDVLVPGAAGTKPADGGMSAMVKLPQALDNLFVRITNEQGQLVRTLDVGAKPAGDSKVTWDGLDENGNALPAGKYSVKANGLLDGEQREFETSTYANVNSVLLGNGDGNVLLNLAGFESPVRLAEVLEVGKA